MGSVLLIIFQDRQGSNETPFYIVIEIYTNILFFVNQSRIGGKLCNFALIIIEEKTQSNNIHQTNNMKKFLMTLAAVFCIMTTAMAQTNSTYSEKYSDSLRKLPPLKVDLETSLSHHSQPNVMQTSKDSMLHKETVSSQSIMLIHKEKNMATQYRYRPHPDYTKTVDIFGDIRDRIVRKRRQEEGRPLQPLPPSYLLGHR
jgi:hypothetical protein